ncbi:PKD-like family lipoprotein [Butyricimonas synergistica]|uniref:PKD-like family lipoprotein n=1 Tax=Butyricimonas synergistica TaxID=544644 RepID=UPI00146A3CD1|nr:PKD-like family lipoprotein [Butyricimonas synergistica]
MKNIIWLFALLFACFACYDDKGNYDYSETNEITIDLRNTQYSAVAGQTINIEPVLTFARDSNETGLEFEWKLGNKLLSNERNLSYYVDTILKENCYFRVLDTKSGITYMAYTNFELTEKFNNQGWLILAEKDGESCLTYMKEVYDATVPGNYTYEEYPDVYQSENNAKLGGKPVGLLEHFYYGSNASNIWVLVDGAESVDLGATSFKRDITLKESFLDEHLPANFAPLAMAEMRWVSAVVNKSDHKVYTRIKLSDKSFFTGSFLDSPLQYEGEDLYVTDFVIAPFMGPGYTLMVEGEKGHQRYLALVDKDKSNAGKVLPLTVSGTYPAGFSSLDDLGDMEVVYTGYSRVSSNSSGTNRYHSVLRNPAGEYYYHEFTIAKMTGTSTVIATPEKQVKFDIGNILDENTLFYVAPYKENSYMLIAHGADLYMIDRANIGNANMSSFVTLYKHFDANITALDAETYTSSRLGVGLENGKFYVLNIPTENNSNMPAEDERVMYESEVNVGKVVDVRFRIKSGNAWPR